MVASTNHLDKLDAGLSSRPSRFDRKYLFPLPSEQERDLYCQFWRAKLKARNVEIEFPKKICPAVAIITDGFSFAYLQEAFVASLLAIAGKRSETGNDEMKAVGGGEDDGDKDLNDYELWREIKKTVKALRDDMSNAPDKSSTLDDPFSKALALEKEAQAPAASSESSRIGQGSKTFPLRPANSDSSERKSEVLRVHGMAVQVDYEKVPIITDDNEFLYGSE